MRSHFARVSLVLSLTLGLGFVSAACGKYSINNLRATQAFQTANEQYKKAEWKSAIPEYTRAVTLNPDLGYAYFFLGNCYDNLYKPTKKGEPDNDANLTKAVENYNLAINKLKNAKDPQAPKILKLSFEYLIAAYGQEKLNDIEKALVFMYLEDKDYAEISETLGISEVNARVKMNRIKGKLRKILNP